MIGQGLTLTVIGMAIVIFFLSLLVVMMVIMSRLVGRVERRRAEKAEAPGDTAMPELPAELPKAPDQPAAEEDDSEIAAA